MCVTTDLSLTAYVTTIRADGYLRLRPSGRPGHGSGATATVAALKGSRDEVWALDVSMQEASWRDTLTEPLLLAFPRS